MNIQHSSRSDSWGTPEWLLDIVRSFLGGIDFDPASSAAFNDIVKAKHFMTSEDDALIEPWRFFIGETIFLNPPGGKIGNFSKTALFWKQLLNYGSRFSDAIFMGFSIECLQTTQNPIYECEPIGHFPLCIPSKRIAFNYENGLPGPQPSHSNVIVWVPGCSSGRTPEQFRAHFEPVGTVIIPEGF